MAQNIAQQKELTALFAKYNIRIGMLYGKFIKQLSALGINVEQKLSEDALFLFDNFPELKTRLNDIFRQYVREQLLLAQSGIQSGVGLAFGQDARTLKGYTVLNDEAIMQVRNLAASAFLAQRMNTPQGLNLSQRVWNYAEQTKSEFEMAMSNVITDGLAKGTSAAELSRKVYGQLQEPDMMYRRYHHKVITKGGAAKDVVKWHKRIIDEEGKVRFIEAPLEEVGQGVYRSSYRNTFRLMRTEINMSYHYANCERWKNEPFVIGIRIWGSPQHPEPDICDELWGDYPKDFKFSGFHPQCMCAASAITASREEIREYHRRKRAGEDVSNFECKGTVKDVPQQYKDYLQQHREQIQRAGERGTLAYVFRDNPKYLRTIFDKEKLQDMGLQTRGRTPEEAKVWRHAQRDDAAAQKRWNEYQLKRAHKAISNAGLNSSSPVLQKRLTALQNAISSGNKDAIKTAYADIWNGIRIQQLADARHAKRNDAAVQSTWNERRKQNALIFNTGRNVLAVADKLAFVETSASAGLLRDLLLQYKLKEAANLTKTLAKQIAEVKKQAAQLEQFTPNALAWFKQFTSAEVQGAQAAIQRTFNRWTWDFDTDASLQFLKGRLEREINVVNGTKYKTKEISKAALQHRLDIVNKRIEFNAISASIQHELQFAATTRSKIVSNLGVELQGMLKDNDASLVEVRAKAADLKQRVKRLEAEARLRAAKSSASATPKASAAAMPTQKMTDTEIKDAMVRLFTQHGESLSAADINIVDGCVYLTSKQHMVLAKICDITNTEKTQTWAHSPGGYIGTSNSFKINGALRDVHGKGKNKIVGTLKGNKNVQFAMDLYGGMLNDDDIKTIETLDAVIARNSLPFPIKIVRNLTFDGVNPLFGGTLPVDSETKLSVNEIATKLKALPLKELEADAGFMSVSTDARMNVFTSRKFQLQIEIPQGTPVYVTRNDYESECVLGRNTHLELLEVEYNSTRKIVEIKCRVK